REQVAAPERRPAHRGDQLDRLDRADPVLRDQELRRAGARECRGLRGAAPAERDTRTAADDQRVPALAIRPSSAASSTRPWRTTARFVCVEVAAFSRMTSAARTN